MIDDMTITPRLSPAEIEMLARELEDVLVDDDGQLLDCWHGYPAGTNREEIWLDIDSSHPDGYVKLRESINAEQEYAMEDLPAMTVGYDKQNECPDIEQKSGRTAVSVGYCFTVVDDQELTDINLKPTGEEVVLDGKVMPLMAGATFLDSQKVDDLLDRHGELRTDEYINHDVDSLAESATRAAAIRRDYIDKLKERAAARDRNVDR